MLGVPQPQPPPHLETNDVERFDVSEVYPQGDGSDEVLSDDSEPGRGKRESSDDEDEDESRYRMRSSKPPPAKRRKSEPYQEYTTDDDYDD